MFYQNPIFESADKTSGRQASALVALAPSESKRLLGKALAALPEVKKALREGTLIIALGTTNAYVAEEVLGISLDAKAEYAIGCISGGELTTNRSENRPKPYVMKQGELVDLPVLEALKEFMGDDVFIKGANAVDPWGNAGILVAGEGGGTIGQAWPLLMARGAYLIVPVGLEKLVPSVLEASPKCGIFRFKYSTGLPAGLIPLLNAHVVTEVQAFAVLTGVSATHVASGGIGGSEGSVMLALEGDEDSLEKAFDLVKSIKGEPPVSKPQTTLPPAARSHYDALALWQAFHTLPRAR